MSLHSFQRLLLFLTVAQSQARIQAICAAKPFCLVVDLMASGIRRAEAVAGPWQGGASADCNCGTLQRVVNLNGF